MKLWKRLIFIFVIAAASSVLAFAHPGNTDSKGGHTDSSTGEYHYHHGYPAHQHTGGVCPYDFDDQTGRNSGTSSTKEANQKPAISKEVAEVKEVPSWVYWVYAILGGVIIWLIFVVRNRNAEISEKDSQLRNKAKIEREATAAKAQLEATDRKLQEKMAFEKEAFRLNAQLRNAEDQVLALQQEVGHQNEKIFALKSYVSDLIAILEETRNKPPTKDIPSLADEIFSTSNIKIPDDVYFIDGFVPVIGWTSVDKPFGDLTVYTSATGKCYHSNPHCGSGILSPAHAYDVIGKKSPCINCAKHFPSLPPAWYRRIKYIANNRSQK